MKGFGTGSLIGIGVVSALWSAGLFAREIDFAPDMLGFDRDVGLEQAPMRFAYYPTAGRIRVSHGTTRELGRTGVFRIRDAKGKVLFERVVNGEKEWSAAVPDLREATRRSGNGSYVAEFVDAAGPVERIPFRRDVFEWEGNQIGRSDVVPGPFEPVRITLDGDAPVVGTVLREHRLGTLGLPVSIIADGKELLAAPMSLVCVKDGKSEEIRGRGLAVVERKNQYAKFKARLDSEHLAGSVDCTWWMDGMLDWRLTLERGSADGLSLCCRLVKGESKLMHACTDWLRINYAGKIPDGVGMVWHGGQSERRAMASGFVPYLWIGGPVRGISVFGENDNGWEEGYEPYQKICRTSDGEAELVVTLLSFPVEVRTARTFRLGFQATPVKPMTDGWRLMPENVLFGCCHFWGAQTPYNDLLPYDGTDSFFRKIGEARMTGNADWGCVDEMARNYRHSAAIDAVSASNRLAAVREAFAGGLQRGIDAFQSGLPTCFYVNARGIRFGNAEGRTFGDEWYRFKFANRKAFDIDASCAYELDPVPSYLDFAAGCWKKMFESRACDMILFDDMFLAANFNPETSDAFTDSSGVVHPASGVFNMRDLVLRCAVLQKELGAPRCNSWIHMTNAAIAPLGAFAGMQIDWEDNGKTNALQERYSRECIQATATGRQFGNCPFVNCYFGPGDEDSIPELEEQAAGVLLTHEIGWCRGGWLRVKPWKDAHAAMVRWGYGASATKVWNYWDPDSYPVEVSGPETSSLVVRRSDGEVLIVVSSWSRQSAEVSIRPSSDLCAAPFSAADFLTGESLSVRDGVVAFPLKGYAWRIVKVSPRNLQRKP